MKNNLPINLPNISQIPLVPKRHQLKRILVMVFIAIVIAAGSIAVYRPISDKLTIKDADPAIVHLAQQAGMSYRGELLFLRTDPKLVSDSQMETDCASNTAANNSNGFIEQGCYVPTTNRIYIRQMPANLGNLEVSTAAYEMLHIVYINLDNSSQATILNQAIEANYKALNDSSLKSQVANFAKTEPGARDLELFSLLGTGYSNLSSDLNKYYQPYFDNLQADVSDNQKIDALFKSSQASLSKLQGSIDANRSAADAAYSTSVYWAQAGSQYEDTYYYNLYVKDVSVENAAIDKYNTSLKSYNALVTEYDGSQPVSQIHSAQTQGQ